MRSQRIAEIEQYIYSHKTVTLDELCEVFQVSKNTIRRDIEEITKNPDIVKTYGGVMINSQTKKMLVSFTERNISRQDGKRRIAEEAAALVNDGDSIFIDSGTTTLYMLEYLKNKKITLLTNNIEVIVQAIPYENINLISLSGTLNRKTLSLTGNNAARLLSTYNVKKAFMAATGVTLENGATNSSPEETCIKEMAVKKSLEKYLLADSSKFGVVSLLTYSDVDDLTGIITDKQPDEDFCEYAAEHQVQIIVAD
ncbi:MAG: DeoR/GlpR transcriptional regulator [Clostridia bacterium]|nr:DeoR/GlpR transcriptional regulator [Clostridia bacterium]NCC44366.1 DeoR/GlpR transcriptional regulator [Clostridia bacterium]